jgi:hypothetical protein
MKNRKKLFVFALVCIGILAIITGILIARECETHSVYTFTSSQTETFTDQTQGAWSYSVVTHRAGSDGSFSVIDQTTSQTILEFQFVYPNTYAGPLSMTYGHEYMIHTNYGNLTPPGMATCTVVSAAYDPDRP